MMNHNSQTILMALLLTAASLPAMAQKFDPQRFEAERAAYMTREVQLNPQDSVAFFTLFYEMQDKKRALHHQMKQIPKEQPSTEDSCRVAISGWDDIDLRMKAVEQDYHQRMMDVLKPSQVFRLLKAEADFCRQTFRRAAKKTKE